MRLGSERFVSKRDLVAAGFALISIFALPSACAWNYSATPRAKTVMRVDDNIRGVEHHPDAAWGFDLNSTISLQAQTESITSDLIPRVNLRRFIVGEDLDADEYGVVFNNAWNTPRSRRSIDFSYNRDSTLSTESTDTGRNVTVIDRDSISVHPSVAFQLSDRWILQTGYLYNTVDYLTSSNSNFIDYSYQDVDLRFTYQSSEKLQIFAATDFSYFNAGSGFSITRSYRGQFGGTYQWDETLEFSGSVGWVDSNVKFIDQQFAEIPSIPPITVILDVPAHGASDGPIASASLQKTLEQSTLNFDFVRQVSPSGRGAQSSSDRISAAYLYKITNYLNAQAQTVYEMQSTDGESFSRLTAASSLNRDYLELVGTIRYQLSNEWQLAGIYRHAIRKSTNSDFDSSVDSNTIYMTIEYSGKRLEF